jgi:ketosteroid isomerase-like protein
MKSDENKQWMLAAWKTFGSRDAQRIAELFTEDAEWLAPEANATARALGGSHHICGREPIARFLASEMHSVFRDIQIEIRSVLADADTVIIEEHMRAQLPNGKLYENDYCFLFELKGRRIHRVREYMDTQRGTRAFFG